MESQASLPTPLVRWVETLRKRGLADLADLFVRCLQVWGFVGGQLLWMVAPFLGEGFGEGDVAAIAKALEDPRMLDALKTCATVDADIATGASR